MDTDQPASFFWNNIGWIISTLVAIGVGLLTVYYQRREKSPTVIATVENLNPRIQSHSQGAPTHAVRFHLSSESSDKWVIYKVRSPEVYNNWLGVPNPATMDDKGKIIFYMPGRPWIWMSRIWYRPPVSKGTILLHPDVEEYPQLIFCVRLRSRPCKRRKVKVLSTMHTPD